MISFLSLVATSLTNHYCLSLHRSNATNAQHDSREPGTSLSLLGNRVPSKRACCFDVPDLIIDSTMPRLTKRFYWWP